MHRVVLHDLLVATEALAHVKQYYNALDEPYWDAPCAISSCNVIGPKEATSKYRPGTRIVSEPQSLFSLLARNQFSAH